MRIPLNTKSVVILGLVLLQAFVVLISACGGESATPVGTVLITQTPATTVALQSDSGQPSTDRAQSVPGQPITVVAQSVPSGQGSSSQLVRDWDQLLRGSRLSTQKSDVGSSGSSFDNSDLDLCSDGIFNLYNEFIVSVGGGGAKESSSEGGEWYILEERGQAYLVLAVGGGETFAGLLELVGNEIYVEGELQLYGATEGC